MKGNSGSRLDSSELLQANTDSHRVGKVRARVDDPERSETLRATTGAASSRIEYSHTLISKAISRTLFIIEKFFRFDPAAAATAMPLEQNQFSARKDIVSDTGRRSDIYLLLDDGIRAKQRFKVILEMCRNSSNTVYGSTHFWHAEYCSTISCHTRSCFERRISFRRDAPNVSSKSLW